MSVTADVIFVNAMRPESCGTGSAEIITRTTTIAIKRKNDLIAAPYFSHLTARPIDFESIGSSQLQSSHLILIYQARSTGALRRWLSKRRRAGGWKQAFQLLG
jgi:hypothetical protein